MYIAWFEDRVYPWLYHSIRYFPTYQGDIGYFFAMVSTSFDLAITPTFTPWLSEGLGAGEVAAGWPMAKAPMTWKQILVESIKCMGVKPSNIMI